MARATAVPTAVSSTRRAALERTRVKNVMLASLPSRTSYARSVTLLVATDLDAAGLAGPPAGANVRGRADGSANCCWRTCAGGGPRRRGVVAA